MNLQIYDWSPAPVNPDNLEQPEYDDMSDQLKLRIRKSYDKNYVWIECKGRNPADRSDKSATQHTGHINLQLFCRQVR